MAYRKLGRDNKHRRAMLANLTKDVINNESIKTKSFFIANFLFVCILVCAVYLA